MCKAVLSALLALLSCSALPPREEVNLSVPPLEGEQTALWRIVRWGPGLVVFASDGALALDEAGNLVALRVPGCQEILDVFGGARAAVCRSAEGLWLVDALDPLTPEHVSPAAATNGARLVMAEGVVAVVTEDSIRWRSRSGPWREAGLRASMPYPPHKLLFDGDTLWIGFNFGEFGGGLYRVPVAEHGDLGEPEWVSDLNVVGIASALGGGVWVAGGLAHMGLNRLTLMRIRNGETEIFIDQEGFFDEPLDRSDGRYSLPRGSAPEAFALSETGSPLLLTGRNGLFEILESGPNRVRSGEFCIAYPTGDVITHVCPTDMVVEDGALVIATNGIGLLKLDAPWRTSAPHQLEVPSGSFDTRGGN